jgi:hypothetical protein
MLLELSELMQGSVVRTVGSGYRTCLVAENPFVVSFASSVLGNLKTVYSSVSDRIRCMVDFFKILLELIYQCSSSRNSSGHGFLWVVSSS